MTFARFFTCTLLLVFLAQQLGAPNTVTGTSPSTGSIVGGTKKTTSFNGFTGTTGVDFSAVEGRAGASSLDVTPPFGQDAISQVFPYPSCSSVTDTFPVLPLVKHGFRVSPSRFSTVTFLPVV